MGLLDNRNPNNYQEKLDKFIPLYRVVSNVLSLRKSKVIEGGPQKASRFFAYHLLTQQGIPGGIKVAFVLSVMSSPFLIAQLISSRYHPYKRDPFRT